MNLRGKTRRKTRCWSLGTEFDDAGGSACEWPGGQSPSKRAAEGTWVSSRTRGHRFLGFKKHRISQRRDGPTQSLIMAPTPATIISHAPPPDGMVVVLLCGDARPHLTKRLPTTNVIRANGPPCLDGRSSDVPVLHTMLEGLCSLDCSSVAREVCDRNRRIPRANLTYAVMDRQV